MSNARPGEGYPGGQEPLDLSFVTQGLGDDGVVTELSAAGSMPVPMPVGTPGQPPRVIEEIVHVRGGRGKDGADDADAALTRAIADRVAAGGDLGEVRDLLAQQDTNRAREHRRRMWRRGMVVGGVGAVAATAAAAIIIVPDLLLPHPKQVTTVDVQAGLSKIVIRNDPILVTGEGEGSAHILLREEWCNVFGCLGMPGTSENAGATVSADLNVVQKAGSVTLQAVSDGTDKSGNPTGWHIVATVNPQGLTTEIANPHISQTGNLGFFPQVASAFGLGSNDNNDNHDAAIVIAEDNYESSCGVPLAEAIAPAEASAIQEDVREVAGALTKSFPASAAALGKMANAPVYIRYQVPTGAKPTATGAKVVNGTKIVLAEPSFTPGSDQKVSLPGGVGPNTLDMILTTDKNSCALTPEAADQLAGIKANQNYVLEPVG